MFRRGLALSTLALGAALALRGGDASSPRSGEWISAGPDGADAILSLAIDPTTPSTVYAGTGGGGVYRSDDDGQSWFRVSDATVDLDLCPRGGPIGSVRPLGRHRIGLYRGIADGAIWQPAALPRSGVDAITFDRGNRSTVYVVGQDLGVYRSPDSGVTWRSVGSGISGSKPARVVLDGSGVVYVGTLEGGVLRSADRGETWTSARSGLTTQHVTALDVASDGTLFAGTADAGVFKSTDGGTNWRPAWNLNQLSVRALAVDPAEPRTVLAGCDVGVFRTIDGGATWGYLAHPRFPEFPPYADVLVTAPTAPGLVYAGRGSLTVDVGSVFRSADFGITWRDSARGIRNNAVISLAATDGGVYAGKWPGAGLFLTTDRGKSWSTLNVTGQFTAITVDPTNSKRIYLGSPIGVDISSDGGKTHVRSNTGLTDPNTHAIAVDPVQPDTVYLGNDAGLNRSTDGGRSWTAAWGSLPAKGPFDSVSAILVDPFSHRSVYAATDHRIFKTRDGTATWFEVSSGIPSDANVLCLEPDTRIPDTIYAGTTAGVYRTSNGGGGWALASRGIGTTRVAALLFDAPHGVIYAGTDSGVFESADGGATFTLSGTGLVNPKVNALALDPAGTLFAATDGAGVFFLLPPLEDRAPLSSPPSRRPRPPVLPRSGS